jgi:hypothetical protein
MVKPGDWVLIHVGFAMAKMDEEEARASLAFLKETGQAFTDEILTLYALKDSVWGHADHCHARRRSLPRIC